MPVVAPVPAPDALPITAALKVNAFSSLSGHRAGKVWNAVWIIWSLGSTGKHVLKASHGGNLMAITASVYLCVIGLGHLENWLQPGLAVDYWLWHHSVCESCCEILREVNRPPHCYLGCWSPVSDGLELNCLWRSNLNLTLNILSELIVAQGPLSGRGCFYNLG